MKNIEINGFKSRIEQLQSEKNFIENKNSEVTSAF